MDFIWESITDWLKEILISGIVSNLSGMFDSTNEQVGNIIGQVGMTPQSWNSGIFTMIQNLSNTVILPIAGAILAIVMTLELIQLITDRNNLNDVDTWLFFKWVFKSACAVVIVTHTWDIVMGIFEASQSVVSSAAGVIVGQTNIDISSVVGGLESRLNEMELGPLGNSTAALLMMLNQAAGDRKILAQQLGISPHQLSYVTHSNSGEGLLFYGDTIVPFVDHFPEDTELYRLMTTKPADIKEDAKP